MVVQRDVVQHQAFALRLLAWIEALCTHSVYVRTVVQKQFYASVVSQAKGFINTGLGDVNVILFLDKCESL